MANRLDDAFDSQLVIAYVSNIPPVHWIDWRFRFEDSPAGEQLHAALFDSETDLTRDLKLVSVRDTVLHCVLTHSDLFAHVLREAQQLLNAGTANDSADHPNDTSDIAPPPAFYACGLNSGGKLLLIKDIPVSTPTGEIVRVHRAGGIWDVLAPTSAIGVLWLRRPDGAVHTWDDNQSVFEFFSKIERDGT